MNSRDVEPAASPVLRTVTIELMGTVCGHGTEVLLAEEPAAVVLLVANPA
ncbi:MAG: hypothetical protein IT196_28355 [Acidimicrobiales bacterium]|nr:hypothetical protein [Acidimicrobiales bacterium]